MKALFLMFLLIGTLSSHGQNKSKEEIELGTRLKTLYPDATVCAISSKIKYTFDIENDTVNCLRNITEEFVALKENAMLTVVENYNHYSTIDRIRTFSKTGKTYTVIPYQTITDRPYFQSDIFDDDNRYKLFKLSFSSLGDGGKYEIQSFIKDIKYVNSSYFHSPYPTEEISIVYEIPDWLQVDLKEFNFTGFDIKKTSEYNEKKKLTLITYTLSHCIAMKKEENAPSISFLWPHIVLIPKKYTERKGASHVIFETTDDLYNWYAYLVSKTVNNKEALKTQVNILTEGKLTDFEKVKAIYYWVQDNIRYIAFESGLAGFIPENCDKVYTSKYGDCKGMANLLTNMLQIAGYNAQLTWIGTKDIPYDYTLPSLIVDNHMICTLTLNDNTYFLDGTENFCALGDYAHRIQGRPALIQDGKKYKIKYVPDLPKERNTQVIQKKMVLKGQVLEGEGKNIYEGEMKTTILRAYAFSESDKRADLLDLVVNNSQKNYAVADLKTSSLHDREHPLQFDYTFKMQNQVTEAGIEIYVSIDFSKDFEGLMPDDKRQNDYYLNEKINRIYTTEFEVPKGFKVKYIPESLNINKADYKFDVSYTQKGNKIILNKMVSLDNGTIKKASFPEWKKDLKQLKKINSEQIVLIPEDKN